MKNYETAESEILDCCLAGRLRMLSRHVTSLYEEALRPLGLRAGQLTLLAMIAEWEPVTASELSKHNRIEKSTLSRDLAVMQKAGWIQIEVIPGQRERPVQLTHSGRALLKKAWPLWKQAQQVFEEQVGDEGKQAIHQLIKRTSSATG